MTPITFSLATCECVLASDLDSCYKLTANHLIAMDETAKPLRIPPEMAIYAEKHEIFDLVQTLVTNLMVDKPEDPIQYLIVLLKRGSVEVPRVMLLGPPASGKRTVARKLCEHTQVIHITDSNILQEDTDLTKKALQYKAKQQEIPCDLWIKLIQQRLSKIDCVRRGWVLEGIPQTREEALSLQEAGVAPNHVVLLEAPDAVLIERSQGKRIDPVTGDVYHVTFIWPEDKEVVQRLERQKTVSEEQLVAQLMQHHREVHALRKTYRNCLKGIDADQPHVDVFDQVCCGELLEAVSADVTNMGELIKPYLESGQQVPDSMVLQILTERLSRLDCTTRGWVLHGFPRDLEQAEKLQESNFIPSRVFFLEMTDDVAIERVTLRSIDPFTGEKYHSLYKPAPSPEVQTRLQFNPKDSEAQLLRQLKEYWANASSLQDLYPEAVHINADQDPHTVFESLESRLVGRLQNDA
ncbi:adenylate kinase 8 isoform X4 [Salmo salar]|uniref:Adenylate kinase 8 isoform X4 n=1 Tax=Salmo salar TaxID=8030 RepID=A0A1S3PRJ5_SALSA|nr:adenylate kinase 8 isoform X4 [Salmo salar]|eukprot:XP_014030303.1 PREDICTED: adenylate kinase 8 isoform X4 [Salmo salar]